MIADPGSIHPAAHMAIVHAGGATLVQLNRVGPNERERWYWLLQIGGRRIEIEGRITPLREAHRIIESIRR